MARKSKDHYFDNSKVEELLTRYVEDGCTEVRLRDEIMEHAVPLIRNVLHGTNLANVVKCQHAVSLEDLASVSWVQIEKTLYKYEPGRSTKVFSMWTQIAYTACLAHIKKETRDAVRVREWQNGRAAPCFDKREKPDFYAIMDDLRRTVPPEYQDMVATLVDLYETDERPWFGLLGKLAVEHGKDRSRAFLAFLKACKLEF